MNKIILSYIFDLDSLWLNFLNHPLETAQRVCNSLLASDRPRIIMIAGNNATKSQISFFALIILSWKS